MEHVTLQIWWDSSYTKESEQRFAWNYKNTNETIVSKMLCLKWIIPQPCPKKHRVMEISFEIHSQDLCRIHKLLLMWIFAFFTLFLYTQAHIHTHLYSHFWLVSYFLLCTRRRKEVITFYIKKFKFLIWVFKIRFAKEKFQEKIIIFIKSIF